MIALQDKRRWRFPGRTVAIAPLLAAAAAVALAATSALAADTALPSHPDQLKYPPLKYQPPRAADYRVKLANGMVAYLVSDRSIPLVTVHVLMRIGPDLDPPGKEGLAAGTVYLLTRSGTKARSAKALEDRLAYLGAQLESQIGGGGGGPFGGGAPSLGPAEARASINLLSKDVEEGLALLVDCLKNAAFEGDRLKLHKDQALQAIKQRNDDSGSIENYQWSFLTSGDDHWSTRYTTAASIQSITREDLAAFQHRYIGPKNFILAVAGDFDRAAMVKRLEKAFEKWPVAGERPGPPAAPSQAPSHGWFLVEKDVNQGRVSIGLPGLQREDPDIYAARIMNDILGGSTFTSHLGNRIRSDEGLAYQVASRLGGGVYYAEPWRLVYQSKVRSVAYATQIALAEIQKMRDSLVTPEELEVSKNGFIEAFPAQFGTAPAIAGLLAVEELTGRYQRDPSFFANYRDKLGAITAEDVRRVARRLLDPAKLVVLMVGNTSEMMLGDPKHDARIALLAGGPPARLPLRDPMTMKPMANP